MNTVTSNITRGLKHLFAVALVSLVAGGTHASVLYLDDAGDYEPMATTNNFFYGVAPGYDIGSNLYSSVTADFTFTYLGHEAGYSNLFSAYDGSLHNKTDSVGDSFSVSGVGPGLLDFRFYSYNVGAGIDNGSNQGFGAWQSFATILDFTFNSTHYDAILLFDDSGAGPDDNHDDHIIGINVIAITEPNTLALFTIGLICLFLSRRKLLKK